MSAILEVEADCLGACLLDPVAADVVVETLVPGNFIDPKHQAIFAVISHRTRMREPVDPSTIAAALHGEVSISDVSGLLLRVTTGAYARYHAGVICAASKNRDLVRLCAEYQAAAAKAAADPETSQSLCNGLRNALDELSERGATQGLIRLADAEPGFLERLEANQPAPRGIPTGFYDIDKSLGGMRDGEMIVLAARPSVGKSLFASNIAEHVTMGNDQYSVAVFSMEMKASDVYRRFLFGRAEVNAKVVLNATASRQEKDRVRAAHQDLKHAPWFISERAGLTMAQIHAASRRFQNKHGKGLIIIDYLQIMRGEGASRYEMVTNISNECKRMAMDLNCPVLILSQLNRRVEHSDDGIPTLADLRESGAIEQDADVVIFLSRKKQDGPHETLVVVDKNRAGTCGKTRILFDPIGPRFRNMATAENFPGGTKA